MATRVGKIAARLQNTLKGRACQGERRYKPLFTNAANCNERSRKKGSNIYDLWRRMGKESPAALSQKKGRAIEEEKGNGNKRRTDAAR